MGTKLERWKKFKGNEIEKNSKFISYPK
jgi:hypothetical protein